MGNLLEPYGFTDPGHGKSNEEVCASCKGYGECEPDMYTNLVAGVYCVDCRDSIIERAYEERIIPATLHSSMDDDEEFITMLEEGLLALKKMQGPYLVPKPEPILDFRMKVRQWMIDNDFKHSYDTDEHEVTVTEHLVTEANNNVD